MDGQEDPARVCPALSEETQLWDSPSILAKAVTHSGPWPWLCPLKPWLKLLLTAPLLWPSKCIAHSTNFPLTPWRFYCSHTSPFLAVELWSAPQ